MTAEVALGSPDYPISLGEGDDSESLSDPLMIHVFLALRVEYDRRVSCSKLSPMTRDYGRAATRPWGVERRTR